MKLLGCFLSLCFSVTVHAAGVEGAVFENAARFNDPRASVGLICQGIKLGALSAVYNCGKLTGASEASLRAICDGIYGGIQRNQTCGSIRYGDALKAQEKVAQDICHGIFYGVQSTQRCDGLALPGETDIEKLKAKETCLGIYWGVKSWKPCASIGAGDRVQSLCESVRRWNPGNSICK